ncbi:hydrolase [Sedimentitalea nanhaiensis]|uniref:hydrolase n=1 Tax=Sedimentitalea nanhaiensis TaxID=999627 RepID=UPI0003FD9986|nr:hydrolase [Sedimentitalea nanhaiensis]
MLIRARESAVIVIDMQERLVPAMQAPARTIANTRLPLHASARTDVPAILTEQYPQGLGHTVPEIRKAAGNAPILPKMYFSCMEDDDFARAFRALDRKRAVITGMEAHICVVQTAESMVEAGHDVFVVSDATASRSLDSERPCLARLSASGVSIVTTEMVVFEWLGRAGTPAFEGAQFLIDQAKRRRKNPVLGFITGRTAGAYYGPCRRGDLGRQERRRRQDRACEYRRYPGLAFPRRAGRNAGRPVGPTRSGGRLLSGPAPGTSKSRDCGRNNIALSDAMFSTSRQHSRQPGHINTPKLRRISDQQATKQGNTWHALQDSDSRCLLRLSSRDQICRCGP